MTKCRPAGRRDLILLLWLVVVTVVAASSTTPAHARSRHGAPTTPGKYEEWNGEIDEIEIVSAWKLADYRSVSVGAFDTADVKLPDTNDNTYEPVKVVLAGAAEPFVAGLREELRQGIEVASAAPSSAGAGGDGQPKTLLIRAKVLTMDPGSRAKRYFGGFGAGAARTKLAGELVDAETGAVLARFTQERRSGVGMGGGEYVEMMSRNLHTIGKDVAAFLNAF